MAVFYFIFRKKRRARLGLAVFLAWVFIVFISPLSYIIAENLEGQYAALKKYEPRPNQNINVIILGGGYVNDRDITATSQLDGTVALRMMEGLRVYRELPHAKFITSGASLGRTRSQAEVVAEAAVSLGVSPHDTFRLDNTLTTEHEAEMYVRRFGKETPLVIATSALHMKRAVYWFSHLGVKTIVPAPCDYRFKEDIKKPEFLWWPSLKKGFVLDKIIHEVVGLWWGKLKANKGK